MCSATCLRCVAFLGGLMASVVALGQADLGAAYTITDLGTLGGPTAAACDINECGQIVGWSTDASGIRLGFFKHVGQPMWRAPSMYPNPTGGEVLGISSYGVGWFCAEEYCGWVANELGNRRAHYYLFDLFVEIGAASGEPSQANDVNDSGVVVGWLEEGSPQRKAWTFSLGEGLAFLPQVGEEAEARAINEAGEIVGVSSLTGFPGRQAVLWRGPEVVVLSTLGGLNSAAEGINNLGQVVGVSDIDSADLPQQHAYVWLPQPAYGLPAGMHDLGTLPGTTMSAGAEISDTGIVVGLAGGEDPAATVAFVWDARRGMRDLNSLVIDRQDWELLAATAINETGYIVGYGLRGGVVRAFLLTPLATCDQDDGT